MKKTTMTLVTIMSLVSGNLAHAQSGNTKLPSKKDSPTTSTQRNSLSTPKTSKYLSEGFQLGFEYMAPLSSESDVKSKVTGNVEEGVKDERSGLPKHMGLKVGYKQIRRGGMGFDLGLSLLKADRRSEGASELTSIIPTANFILASPKALYGALGINSTMVTGDDSMKHYSRLGFQVGGGLILKKHFNLEIFYNWINQGLESQYALMEERTTSTSARLTYVF